MNEFEDLMELQKNKHRKSNRILIFLAVIFLVIAGSVAVYTGLARESREWENEKILSVYNRRFSELAEPETGEWEYVWIDTISYSAERKSMSFSDPELIRIFREEMDRVSMTDVASAEPEQVQKEQTQTKELWRITVNGRSFQGKDNGKIYMGEDSQGLVRYLQADVKTIRSILLDFLEAHQKSMTMDEVRSLFGKTDLVWRDFECYEEFSSLAAEGTAQGSYSVDLGNGWSLSVSDQKRENGWERFYKPLYRPEHILLKKNESMIQKDIRDPKIEEFWEKNGHGA